MPQQNNIDLPEHLRDAMEAEIRRIRERAAVAVGRRRAEVTGIRFEDLYQARGEDDSPEAVDTEGVKRLKTDCAYYSGRYYYKTHKNVFLDEVTGDYCHVDYLFEYTKTLSYNQNTGEVTITRGKTNHNNREILIEYFSDKHRAIGSGYIKSINDISGWKCKEALDVAAIVDATREELPISKITHYDTFKNYFSGKKLDSKTQLRIGEKSLSYLLTEGIKYTFGIELEVSKGFVPKRLRSQYNMLCVRDGSLNAGAGGAEYVTGVLKGDSGLNHLQDICAELVKRTKVDASCGLHVHLGGVDFTKQLLINSYRAYSILEKEVLSMLPKSRRKNDYCKVLKKFNFRPALKKDSVTLEEDYSLLLSHMTNGRIKYEDKLHTKEHNHPQGAKCGYDKTTPRYCWVNYVPAMFNTRGNGSHSIEIRNHSGTVNFNKIKNWLLIQMAILSYADTYPHLIDEKLTLAEVVSKVFPKRAKILINYIEERKALFVDDENEKAEYVEEVQTKKTIKDQLCV